MQKENAKYSRGADMVSVDGMRCGWYERERGGLVGQAHEPMPSDTSEEDATVGSKSDTERPHGIYQGEGMK